MTRLLAKLRLFGRDRRGGAAVEFALLAPVYLPLMTGTLESSLMLAHQGVLENAVFDAARRIRTGQVQQSVDPLGTFEAELCNGLVGHIPCSELYYNVKNFTNFAFVDMEIEVDENGDPTGGVFDPGSSGDITAVRVAWKYEFHTPMMAEFFALTASGQTTGNSRLLTATAVFRNEPYEFTVSEE